MAPRKTLTVEQMEASLKPPVPRVTGQAPAPPKNFRATIDRWQEDGRWTTAGVTLLTEDEFDLVTLVLSGLVHGLGTGTVTAEDFDLLAWRRTEPDVLTIGPAGAAHSKAPAARHRWVQVPLRTRRG